MGNTTWTNPKGIELEAPKRPTWLYIVVLIGLVAAVALVVYNAIQAGGTQLYLTVDEYFAQESDLTGRDVRVSGWVIGDTIEFVQIDAETSRLEFDIVDDLENPTQRLHIVAYNEPKPDLLQQEAQALVEGSAVEPGVFESNPGGLLLKCPTRYEGEEPILNELGEAGS